MAGLALAGLLSANLRSAQAAFPGTNGKIAFESERTGNDEIYVMNADGSGQTRLTDSSAFDGIPDWQPVPSAQEQLAELAATVDGVGPGSSLAAKVARVQAELAAGDTAAACPTLAVFVHEVEAQEGHRLTAAEASQLVAAAERIEAVLGC